MLNKSRSLETTTRPPFVGVVITVSTGGPQTLKKFFDQLSPQFNCAIFMVQHGPAWALTSMVKYLKKEYKLNFELAENDVEPQINHIYIAPGGTHLVINPRNHRLALVNDPPEHTFRPAADPLFRSAAKAFGKYCVGIVLSGLGNDGTAGIKTISEFGGTILIQDPKTSIARFMPQAAINTGVKQQTIPLIKMTKTLLTNTSNLNQQLSRSKHAN